MEDFIFRELVSWVLYFRLLKKRKALIGQIDHVTFGLFREIG